MINRIQSYALSEKGDYREKNEDSIFMETHEFGNKCSGIFAVADGVGGLEQGEIASSVAVEHVKKWWSYFVKNPMPTGQILESLEKMTLKADGYLKDLSKKTDEYVRMATTLSVFLIYDNMGFITHIGDSKIYRKDSSGIFSQISVNHLRKKADSDRYLLSEYLSSLSKMPSPQLLAFTLYPDERFYIGSDGAFSRESLSLIQNEQKTDLCQDLITLQRKQGERDNISIISVLTKGEKGAVVNEKDRLLQKFID